LSKEQFGTVTPIYNKLFYSLRGQLKEIREGTTYTSPSDTSWNRGAIINSYGSCDTCTDNDGNLRKQEHFIPGDDNPQPSTYQVQTQEYEYDYLNRIRRVHQGTVWEQQFIYDRVGNRRIDMSNTSSALQSRPFELEATTNRLLAPGDSQLTGQSINLRMMRYDSAGNLVHDAYNGEGQRDYDAENRMTRARANNQWQTYSYDAAGRRIRRNVNGSETWQIYGLAGELLAEYAQNAPPTSPQREYAYRNGQMLIAAVAGPSWGSPPTLHDNPLVVGVTTVQSRHITELRVAIDALRSHLGMSAYTWYESAAVGDPIRTDPIEEMQLALDQALGPPSPAYSVGLGHNQPIKAIHIQELRNRVLAAWNSGSATQVYWLVTDQLGTPRMLIHQSGSFTGVSRHDYLPFGEDLSGIGGRSTALGYTIGALRQKFTQKERDTETKLDYFGARYYSSIAGRFTSADEPFVDQNQLDPQSWNLYSYVRNRPIAYLDPLGRWQLRSADGDDVTVVADPNDDMASLAQYLSIPLNILMQWYPNLIARRIPAGTVWSFSASWLKSVGGTIPSRPVQNSVQASDFEFDEDKVGGVRLGLEYFSGRGPRYREFGPRAYATRQMMTSPDVADHRRNFIGQGGGTYGPAVVRFGRDGKDGPFTAGRNMTRQFVGSFYITIQEKRNGDALFTITNTTGLQSLLYDSPGVQNVQRTEMLPLSNKEQEFWWFERGLIKH